MDLVDEMTSSAAETMQTREALHHQNAASAARSELLDDDNLSFYSDDDCSSLSSAETTRLDLGFGHVHYWNGTSPIDLVVPLQNSPQHRRRSSRLLMETDEALSQQEETNMNGLSDQAPLLIPVSPQSLHAQNDDDQLISSLHSFSMFDTPQRLRYWSSSPPQISRVARTMLGIFIVALSFVAFCALLSSHYFSSTGRLAHPVIRVLRGGM